MATIINYECLECGDEFTPGRSDQKFCSTKCRNRKNNRIAKAISQDTQNTDRILHRNFQILKTIERSSISRNELVSLGFNLRYFTHQTRKNNTTTVYCIYDRGYYYGTDNQVHFVTINN